MEEKKDIKPYNITVRGAEAQIEEKKSRFIAEVFPVQTEEEIALYIGETKKKYWDARHHCFAYSLGNEMKLTRFSDDGEPSGTAGKPILEVLLTEEITNTLIIVTRYFGGTLLGTGGLVRAYAKAAKEGLLASEIAIMQYVSVLSMTTDYNHIGKVQYILNQHNILIRNTEYTQEVKLIVEIPIEKEALIIKEITEATSAKVQVEELEKGFCIDK